MAKAGFEARFPLPATARAWTLYLAALLAVTVPRLVWHIRFFHHAGEFYYRVALPLALLFLAVAPLVYWRIRRPALLGREPALLAGLGLAPVVLREPVALALGAVFLLSCHQLGRLALPSRVWGTAAWYQRALLRLAAGMGLMTLALFALASAQALNVWTSGLLMLPAATALPGLARNAFRLRDLGTHWAAEPGLRDWPGVFVVVYGGLALVLAAVSAVTPMTNGDAVRMHGTLIRYYASTGGLRPPEFMGYGYFPQGFELLSAHLLQLGGDGLARLLNPMQFMMTLGLAFSIGRILGLSVAAGWLGVVLAALLPFLHWTGTAVKNDMGAALFTLAALKALLIAFGSGRPGWLLASAFFAGCSLGVKHTALMGVVALGAAALTAARRLKPPRWVWAAAVAICLATPACWYLRTWRATGSPVYPERWQSAGESRLRGSRPWARLVRYFDTPWRIHFRGRTRFESPTDNPMGFLLPAVLPLFILLRRTGAAGAWPCVWTFVLVYFAYWNYLLSMIRYAVPLMVLLSVLAAGRVEAALAWPGLRRATIVALVYCFGFATLVTVILEAYPSQPAFLLNRISREEFLRRELPPFGVMQALHGRAGPDDLVLSIGAWSIAYAPFPGKVNHVYRNSRAYTPADLAPAGDRSYAFLILPAASNLNELKRQADQYGRWEAVYSDPYFRLYRSRP